jgi:ferrochelatase
VAILRELAMPELDAIVCYQSRVGRLKWIEPATDAEIRRAGRDGKRVIVAPIAFVSEHSETLVELDIEYRHLAAQSGVPDYRRAPTVGDDAAFIAGLAGLVKRALAGDTPVRGVPEGCPL